MITFHLVIFMCSLSSLNAIRCWQCACVEGRRCPRDAKVNIDVAIPFIFLVEFIAYLKLNAKSFKYTFHVNKERY